MFRRTKKSQGASWKTQQEARHFALSGHFGHIPHFYFDELVPGLSSDQLQMEMSVITTRWRYKLTQRLIFRHRKWHVLYFDALLLAALPWSSLSVLFCIFWQTDIFFDRRTFVCPSVCPYYFFFLTDRQTEIFSSVCLSIKKKKKKKKKFRTDRRTKKCPSVKKYKIIQTDCKKIRPCRLWFDFHRPTSLYLPINKNSL